MRGKLLASLSFLNKKYIEKTMIRFLNPKDKSNFLFACSKFHPDFYIIEDGKRTFLTDMKCAKKVFNSCLKHGNQCIISEDNGEILGLLIILKDDKTSDKYLKLLSSNVKVTEALLQFLVWHVKKQFFTVVNKSNILFKFCREHKYQYNSRKNYGFQFVKSTNKSIIFKYIPNLVKEKQYYKGEE